MYHQVGETCRNLPVNVTLLLTTLNNLLPPNANSTLKTSVPLVFTNVPTVGPASCGGSFSELILRLRSSASLRDRSSLLGITPPASGRSSPFNDPYGQPNGHRFSDDLEGQNDEALEGLQAKVKLLKDASSITMTLRSKLTNLLP